MRSKKATINPDNKCIIEFFTTSNPWINNGLITLVQRLQTDFESKANIELHHEKIKLISNSNQKLDELICNALHNNAANGTYNFSTSLKFLNMQLKSGYFSSESYPKTEKDFSETIEITDKERDILKKEKNEANPQKKQQVWKQRLSFIASPRYSKKIYIDIGLDLKKDTKFVDSLFDFNGENFCPICGCKTNRLVQVQQQFNPLTSEHHNNLVEGYSKDIRQKISACPKCILLCYFSVFNKNIPFFQVKGDAVYIAIPNAVDLNILRKINTNLSLPNQSINFSDASCTSYSTNIKSLPYNYKSKNSSLLTLLHNIKNEYSKTEPEKLTLSFEEIKKEEFSEVIEWLFISKSFQITHIKADERIYDILEKFKDPQNNEDVYLIPDFLNNFSFSEFDTNVIDQFFEGILKFELKKVSDALFHMAKISAGTPSKIYQKFRPNGSSPLFLFEQVFLPKIMEVKTMLSNELSNACRDLAKSIGKGFCGDVGMMTKFAYASGPREFKMALEDAIFRLAKKSALDKIESNYISEDSLKIIFDSLNAEQFSDIKNNFVSFMSVAAISRNYQNNKGGI